MTASPAILTAFRALAPSYDALICDVWGVLHNGATAFAPACAALKAFRETHGRVILLSNAPRPPSDLEIQSAEIQRIRQQLDITLAKHTGKDVDEIRRDTERDKILTAEEARAYGIIDHVMPYRKPADRN